MFLARGKVPFLSERGPQDREPRKEALVAEAFLGRTHLRRPIFKNGKAHSSALLFSVYPVIVTARGRGHVFFFKCQQTGYKDIR